MANESYYTYQEDRRVTLPIVSSSIAIERKEWNRLKQTVEECKIVGQWFMSIAFCLFGVSGSAFITWLSLRSQKGLDITCLALIITAIGSLVIGGLCVLVQIYLNRNQKSSLSQIKKEIGFIEESIPDDKG